MKTYKFPITVTKACLKDIVKVRGSRNASDYPLGNGDTYDAGSLILLGFVGKLNMANRMYTGHLECRLAQPADDERGLIDFQSLHGDDPLSDAVEPVADVPKKSNKKKKS